MSRTLTTAQSPELLLHIYKEVNIDASPAIAFESLLEQIGTANELLDGTPMPMRIEPWPGGRWYRDLGNNSGHLWGHVQVIKPPTLLEITGPLCMSYAAVSHVQYRLKQEGGGTRLCFTHRAMGEIAPEHRDGMPRGWAYTLTKIREAAERRKG